MIWVTVAHWVTVACPAIKTGSCDTPEARSPRQGVQRPRARGSMGALRRVPLPTDGLASPPAFLFRHLSIVASAALFQVSRVGRQCHSAELLCHHRRQRPSLLPRGFLPLRLPLCSSNLRCKPLTSPCSPYVRCMHLCCRTAGTRQSPRAEPEVNGQERRAGWLAAALGPPP